MTYAALKAEVRGFGQSPESVIRRLLFDLGRSVQPVRSLGNAPSSSSADANLMKFVHSAEFSGKAAKEKYLSLLEFLWREKPDHFPALEHVKFGKRVQIADARDKIEQSGRSTKPEPIAKTGFWALTNLSNRSKRDVIARGMQELGYATADIRLAVSSIPDTHPSPSAANLLEGLL